MDSNHQDFQLSCQLYGHEGDVRDIACGDDGMIITGGTDCVAYCWSSIQTETGGREYIQVGTPATQHQHWVTAVAYIPPDVVPECPKGGFATGSMDTFIRIYSIEGTLIRTLSGHTKGVISLSLSSSREHIISGSWDETARVWSMSDGACISVLKGHENGVCVLGLPNGDIVTGSTGRQDGNSIVDCHVRLWRNGELIQTLSDHAGPVRHFDHVPGIGFLSSSNDGSIILRDMSGNPLLTMKHPINTEGLPSFILGVCCLTTGEFVSVGEDATARVWKSDGTLLQTIQHASGLWCVRSLPNGEFVTGGDDHIVRVFTRNVDLVSLETVASFHKTVEDVASARTKGPNKVDIEKLPLFENRGSIRGKSEGAIQMFRKGNIALACQWSAVSSTWIEIGEVTGTGSGGMVNGIAYDIVIPVEIEDPSTGGIRKLDIGYNQGENAFSVAQEFIDKNHLNQSYLQQIADYIIQRSGSYQAPVIDRIETTIQETQVPTLYTYFPQKSYMVFDSTKIGKLLPTAIEFNLKIKENHEKQQLLQLSDVELASISDVISVTQQTAYYHSSEFKRDGLSALMKMLHWPIEYILPAYDLLRLVIVHPNGHTLIAYVKDTSFFVDLISQGTQDHAPHSVQLLSLRIVANMFLHPKYREIAMQYEIQLFQILGNLATKENNKAVQVSLATVLLNFAVNSSNLSLSSKETCLELIVKILDGNSWDMEAVLRLLVALGTLFVGYPEMVRPKVGVQLLTSSHDQVKACALELEKMFSS